MKITIENDCKEEEKEVMHYVERFCREHFRNCKIKVNELKEEIEWKE